MKIKCKNLNFHPMSGTIDLISRNEKCATQPSNENINANPSFDSRKSSHKRTGSIGTSERSENKSKKRFLVSKKYNKNISASNKLSSTNMKSCITKSLMFGTSTMMSKPSKNQTNIFDVLTPNSATSVKINLKGSLLAKKCLGIAKSKVNNSETDTRSMKHKPKVMKNFKIFKEINRKTEVDKDSRSPNAKMSGYASGKSSNIKMRGSHVTSHTLSTSKRIESQITHSDLYNQILKNRNNK